MILIFMSVLISGATSSHKEDDPNNAGNNTPMANGKIKITVNSQIFTATLYDNETATAFKALLPMTVTMNELNGNEKYYDLTGNLPASPTNPGTIQNGDLMLYGSNTLVLFYKSFSTSYNYTRLARIDNPSGLATALGSGNATVKFEVE